MNRIAAGSAFDREGYVSQADWEGKGAREGLEASERSSRLRARLLQSSDPVQVAIARGTVFGMSSPAQPIEHTKRLLKPSQL
ncbi:hypothetical protein [Caldimonas brevitalea]|uniref:Uncharacterized protein n=1 Tax=Caldimonas brevitalea TaxID=413882 RepID=A0A0G3BQK1_9BURK|nr:hypothetical protein [Caldimonas brevitalea]AKJ28780.1 hypothetical protein AAW51_2089 [Caldimonas brevitalea]